ncbi:hypothetical protein GW17_00034838 [Ensete ventricosum]|nr:hypothetical protein GW17_00034838 [Ensete ventricosum]
MSLEGRPSTYYIDIPIPWLSGKLEPATFCWLSKSWENDEMWMHSGFCILEETELPDDVVVAGAPYLGPELVVVDEEKEDDDDEDDRMY